MDGAAVRLLVSERKRLLRFIRSRIGTAAEADKFVREAFCAALTSQGRLHRGETIIAWLGRVMRLAIADFYREAAGEPAGQLWRDAQSGRAGEDQWTEALRACVDGLLGTIRPRYAELIARLDLAEERKATVARDLGITVSTADVVLHRARHVLRRRLLALCGLPPARGAEGGQLAHQSAVSEAVETPRRTPTLGLHATRPEQRAHGTRRGKSACASERVGSPDTDPLNSRRREDITS